MNVTVARSGAADAESFRRVQIIEKQTGEKPLARGDDRPMHA